MKLSGVKIDKKENGINVYMHRSFLNKLICVNFAVAVYRKSLISGMDCIDIAKELHAHAICYYWYDEAGNLLHRNPIAKELHKHGADGIFIQNGGDTKLRQLFYNIVWEVTDYIKGYK